MNGRQFISNKFFLKYKYFKDFILNSLVIVMVLLLLKNKHYNICSKDLCFLDSDWKSPKYTIVDWHIWSVFWAILETIKTFYSFLHASIFTFLALLPSARLKWFIYGMQSKNGFTQFDYYICWSSLDIRKTLQSKIFQNIIFYKKPKSSWFNAQA